MVGVKENKEIVACILIIGKKIFLKHYFYYVPRGMLLDYNNKELLNFFTTNIENFIDDKLYEKIKFDTRKRYL